MQDKLEERQNKIEKIYMDVLGRHPSSREILHYKYVQTPLEEIYTDLINSQEHKDILERNRKYKDTQEDNRKLMSAITKMRNLLDDKSKELSTMKSLLVEKNNAIKSLRLTKQTQPYDTRAEQDAKQIFYTPQKPYDNYSDMSLIDKIISAFK